MADPKVCDLMDSEMLQAEIKRLNKIVQALMNRAEGSARRQGSDYGLFQTTILLGEQVRQRTADLEAALRENEKVNRALKRIKEQLELEIQERKRIQEALEGLQAQLREQAIHDSLTGLYNRRYLEETFDRELARAKRNHYPVSVILGDLDFFKVVNDTYGHPGGDAVLRVFGTLMKSHSRSSDICCRYGGEEFLLILFDMRPEEAGARAERLRVEIEDTPVVHGEFVIRITASFGIAAFPEHGESADLLIAAADAALYAAKKAGRNTVRGYVPLAESAR